MKKRVKGTTARKVTVNWVTAQITPERPRRDLLTE